MRNLFGPGSQSRVKKLQGVTAKAEPRSPAPAGTQDQPERKGQISSLAPQPT